jgi:hypothetical protein
MVLDWQCSRCTHCCRAWRVDVAPAALREMALHCSEAGDLAATLRLMAQHPTERRLDGSCALPMDGAGACVFLEGNLCGYRVKHGTSTLPASCAKFPFVGVVTPKRRLLGLSFACPTALQALLEERRVELVEDYPGAPPTDVLTDFCGDGSPDQAAQAEAFWELHWEWLSFARRATAPPEQWLRTLAEQASGMSLPSVEVSPSFWSRSRFSRQAAAPLLAEGASEQVLAAVFDDPGAPQAPADAGARGADDRILNRYLVHRLLVPEFLVTGASLGRLLGVLFAIVARYRIERSRGHAPGRAVANIDRLILHSDYHRTLFPDAVGEAVAWPSLALLALVRQPPEPG